MRRAKLLGVSGNPSVERQPPVAGGQDGGADIRLPPAKQPAARRDEMMRPGGEPPSEIF
jgi:hypothetical protein